MSVGNRGTYFVGLSARGRGRAPREREQVGAFTSECFYRVGAWICVFISAEC